MCSFSLRCLQDVEHHSGAALLTPARALPLTIPQQGSWCESLDPTRSGESLPWTLGPNFVWLKPYVHTNGILITKSTNLQPPLTPVSTWYTVFTSHVVTLHKSTHMHAYASQHYTCRNFVEFCPVVASWFQFLIRHSLLWELKKSVGNLSEDLKFTWSHIDSSPTFMKE